MSLRVDAQVGVALRVLWISSGAILKWGCDWVLRQTEQGWVSQYFGTQPKQIRLESHLPFLQ
jgi:hypothetical protein